MSSILTKFLIEILLRAQGGVIGEGELRVEARVKEGLLLNFHRSFLLVALVALGVALVHGL